MHGLEPLQTACSVIERAHALYTLVMPEALAIPELHTDRLLLRGHRLEDFPHTFALWSDLEVTKFISGRAFTREEIWARFLRYRGHWSFLGYGYWAIFEKTTGAFVGEAGIGDFHRDLTPSLDGTPELGWVLASEHHGKGYATQAVRTIAAWGDAHFGAVRTACIIAPENIASLRVAEKNGFREFTRTTFHGKPAILFERTP
jgi:RimJ/RimL family protein N-acetyltransferase